MLPSDPFHSGVGNAALIEKSPNCTNLYTSDDPSRGDGNELAGGLSDIKGTWQTGCLLLTHTEILRYHSICIFLKLRSFKNSDQHSS